MTNSFTMFHMIFLDFALRTWIQCTFLVLRFFCIFMFCCFRLKQYFSSIRLVYNTPLDTWPQPILGLHMHCL